MHTLGQRRVEQVEQVEQAVKVEEVAEVEVVVEVGWCGSRRYTFHGRGLDLEKNCLEVLLECRPGSVLSRVV